MTTPAAPSSTLPHAPSGRKTLWALILNILCITSAELFLKTGAGDANDQSLLALSALHSPATIAGIFFYIAAFVLWMYALRTVPLSLAYNFTAINQVLIPIAAWIFLKGEQISPLRWCGIALVFIGFILLAPILARVESHPLPEPTP